VFFLFWVGGVAVGKFIVEVTVSEISGEDLNGASTFDICVSSAHMCERTARMSYPQNH
jgi:hypothetical protein